MKVLFVGDSPFINTGFGRVNARAVKRLQSEGHQVASVAGLTKVAPEDDEGVKIYLPSNAQDVLGIRDIEGVVKDFHPDVIYMTADPGSVTALAYGAPDMPAFIYTPIEGEPINNADWRRMLATLPAATVSKYGQELVKRTLNRDIPYYYHGVDHDIFQVTGVRDDVRKAMGWQDKFVITCVSTNVRRKQLPRLIEAFARLKHQYKQKDIVLYLHTVPFQNYWLEGWNLMEIVRMFDVEKEVFFHPFMAKMNASIPLRSNEASNPGLVEMYNASDLFVLPSQVEGFGLPIAESMACGVPVMVTQYAAGWEIAQPAGVGIPVADWEVHKSGTMYANVSVELLAKAMLRLIRNPKELQRMASRGLVRAQDFTWDAFEDSLIKNLEDAIDAHTVFKPETRTQEQDSTGGTTLSETEDPATEGSGEEGLQTMVPVSKGQGEDSGA